MIKLAYEEEAPEMKRITLATKKGMEELDRLLEKAIPNLRIDQIEITITKGEKHIRLIYADSPQT